MRGIRPFALAMVLVSGLPPIVAAPSSHALPARSALCHFYDPVIVVKVAPKYPPQAIREKAEGLVVLQGIIQIDGSVSDLVVLRSESPGHGFEKAAIDAVKQWKYAAAVENRRPVEVYYTIVLQFALEDRAPRTKPPARLRAPKDRAWR